jgi:hypothetical protein
VSIIMNLKLGSYFLLMITIINYNLLLFRVRLSKRRTNHGKIGNTRLNVKYREYNKQELKNQVNLFIF